MQRDDHSASEWLKHNMKVCFAIALLLALCPVLVAQNATDAQKKEFIELLKTLPTRGEFYTPEAVQQATRYLPVLLSLTEKDIEQYDLYPFVALSGGLSFDKQNRTYVLSHFNEIRHAKLKLGWAVLLFNAGDISRDVVHHLRDALLAPAGASDLSGMVGHSQFKFFRRKVLSHPYANDEGLLQWKEDEGHTDWVVTVAFSPDGKTLASGSHDGTVLLWDVATGRQVRAIEDHRLHGKPFEVVSVAFSPDGKRVASASSDKTVRVWEVSTGAAVWTFSNVKYAQEVTFSQNGNRLAVANCATVLVWNLNTGTLLRTISKARFGAGSHYCAGHVAFLENGRKIVADAGPIQIWQVATGQELKRFKPDQSDSAMTVSTDGTKLLLGGDVNSASGVLELRDLASGNLLRRFPEQTYPVESVAFSPDGKIIASDGRDGMDISSSGYIHLWDSATGAELHRLVGHQGPVAGIAFAPDGKTLASASWDNSVKLWDVATGKEIRSFPNK
jgi:WD40 repeat protein